MSAHDPDKILNIQKSIDMKIRTAIELANTLPKGRNMAMVITNLENAQDKLDRVIRGE